MHADADVVLTGGEVHTLGESDETHDAVAVRGGRIARLDSDYEMQFSVGVETDVIDLDGRVVLPGFVDVDAAVGGGGTRRSLRAAARRTTERGVTTVHDRVEGERAAAYRELDADGTLPLRVAFDYGYEALDAVETLGARTGHGSDRAWTGALAVPAVGDDEGEITPAIRRDVLRRADEAGFRIAARAADSASVASLLDDYERATADPGGARHRVVGVEAVTPAIATRLAETGVVTVVPPGSEAIDTLFSADARVAFGGSRSAGEGESDDGRGKDSERASERGAYDPLAAADAAVERGVGTTDALRAATDGGAYAGGDEARYGTLAVGGAADLVVLDRSPWAAESIADVGVAMTVVDGEVVHDARQ
ncbi:amidohydrolase family protein [Halarchaeum nitratireducens]|uniref:Amidohydrolase 3 domain-containing protein n=1 Tax=Halarchaeum nitratireducens TaxID=489913 RepID=A0A830G7V8_9EURY|nr:MULTISPECIES: amidohydrolase family protein [Halarchaeum]MBP2251441.1 putative amidohydrolase YtcJ [Halarchaeum solikamskense]GGN07339.1 hypothetical protein GCM10009021_03010 [Halarchaeum nitratireducens]